MKRFLSFLLIILLLFGLSVSALAAGTSRYCAPASYREWQEVLSRLPQDDAHLTRGECAELLYLGLAAPGEASPSELPDASRDWSRENDLFPMDYDEFTPEEEITREELSLAISRALTAAGRSVPLINAQAILMDGGNITGFCCNSVVQLQRAGIIIEDGERYIFPTATVPHKEAMDIFLRLFGSLSAPDGLFRRLPVSTVPESSAVDESWFDDVCFIGHSQVVGMEKHFQLNSADYYAVIGHTARGVVDYDEYPLPNGGLGTLDQALHQKAYGKVYIMLGINDCNDREDRIEEFLKPMRQIMDLVTETQPEARIYLLSLAPVGSWTMNNAFYNPENTVLYSQAVKDLSREYQTEYLDLFRLMADENGYMQDIFNAGDGIHIVSEQYGAIRDFIMTHT